jgi:hypothetical protein
MANVRITVWCVVTLIALIGRAVPANASCATGPFVTSCPSTCTTNCYLHGNVSCTSGHGITLNSGAKLDMCGFSLICTDPVLCSLPAAVYMTASSSAVLNSSSAPGIISGLWTQGIDCSSKTGTKVTGIRFDGPAFAITDCAKIEQNVIVNGNNAIYIYAGAANTDVIDNNYISVIGAGILVDSGDIYKITIDHNIIATGSTGYDAIDVSRTSATSYTISNNIFFSQVGTVPIVPSLYWPGTYSDNYCDPNSSACAACVSNGYCASPPVPFVLP